MNLFFSIPLFFLSLLTLSSLWGTTLASSAPNDACSFVAGTPIPVTALRTCLDAIPPDPRVLSDTLAQLRHLADLYAFVDSSMDSGAPFNIRVNLFGELDRIAASQYASDYAFHQDLSTVFSRLGDAHTLYYPAPAYASFLVVTPFLFSFSLSSSTTSQDTLEATVSGVTQFPSGASYSQVAGMDLGAAAVGKQLVRVNGVPVVDWIQGLGDRAGISRDRGVRFNNAVKNLIPALALGRSISVPDQEAWTYEFADGSRITVPLYVYPTQSFADAQTLYESTLSTIAQSASHQQPSTTRTMMRKMASGATEIYEHYAQIRKLFPPIPTPIPTPTEQHPEKAMLLYASLNNTAQCSLLTSPTTAADESDTMVLALRGFYTLGDDAYVMGAWYLSFLNTLQQCLLYAQTHHIGNLLLDVASNGGGIICLATNTLQTLFPNEYALSDRARQNLFEPYDNRKSPLSDALQQNHAPLYNATSRMDPVSARTLPASDSAWYDYDVWMPRGNSNAMGRFTPRAFYPSECADGGDLLDYVPNPVVHAFDRILLLSDGLCGSACSIFSSKLRFHGKALVATVGGRPEADEAMESASFSGGVVLDWDVFLSEVPPEFAPQLHALPTLARTRFTFGEMYMGNSPTPREFSRIPGDFRIRQWDVLRASLASLYDQASLLFADPQWVRLLEPLGDTYSGVPFAQQARPYPNHDNGNQGNGNDNNDDEEEKKKRTVGLAVGLSLGLSVLICSGIGVALWLRNRRSRALYLNVDAEKI